MPYHCGFHPKERAAAEAEAAEGEAGTVPAVDQEDLKGGLGSGEGPLIPTND